MTWLNNIADWTEMNLGKLPRAADDRTEWTEWKKAVDGVSNTQGADGWRQD